MLGQSKRSSCSEDFVSDSMWRYLTISDVYDIIVENDVTRLEEAVFYLGFRIHTTQVWCRQIALVYAAQLGHVTQAGILLRDLRLYYPDTGDRNFRQVLTQLVHALVPSRAHHTHFLSHVLTLLFQQQTSILEKDLLTSLVAANAIDVIDTILSAAKLETSAELDEFKAVISDCINYGVRTITESIFFEKHLMPADFALFGDEDEIMMYLKREDLGITSYCHDSRVAFIYDKSEYSVEKEYPLAWFVVPLLRMDDAELFRNVFSGGNFEVMVSLHAGLLYWGKGPVQASVLLEEMLYTAADEQLCNIIPEILHHPALDCSQIQWIKLYYELVVKNCLKSAQKISHLADFSDRNTKAEISRRLDLHELDLDHLVDTIATGNLMRIIEEVEELNPGMKWREKLVNFPREKRRPDLVSKFHDKFSLTYTEQDVWNKMMHDDCQTRVDLWRGERPHLQDTPWSFCHVFLGHYTKPPIWFYCTNNTFPTLMARLTDCVVQCGGKRTLIDYANPSAAVPLENLRFSNLTLQKLCRLTIRKTIIINNIRRSDDGGEERSDLDAVHADLLSLARDGHLSKVLADYLLFRDGRDPLYYKLLVWLINDNM